MSGCSTPDSTPSTFTVTVTEAAAETIDAVGALETATEKANQQTASVKDSAEQFVDQVWDVFADSVCEYELISDVRIKDKNLIIKVDLPELTDTENMSVQEITINSTSSIADPILDLTEYYDLWDSITVDFGSLGYSTNTKANITGDNFPYFKNIEIQSQ